MVKSIDLPRRKERKVSSTGGLLIVTADSHSTKGNSWRLLSGTVRQEKNKEEIPPCLFLPPSVGTLTSVRLCYPFPKREKNKKREKYK